MRVFWSFIGLLILAGVGAAAWSGLRGTQAGPGMSGVAGEAATKETQGSGASGVVGGGGGVGAVPGAAGVAGKIDGQTQVAARAEEAAAAPVAASVTEEAARAVPKAPPIGATTIPTPARAGGHQPGHVPANPVAPAGPVGPREEPAADPGATMPEGVPAKLGEYDVRPVRIEAKEDGSVVLDGRFTLRGKGTKDEPYRVPWELLVSAKDTFEPAAGLKKIPGRVAMLHEKFVRLDGYVAFPLMMQKPTELLSMLNQWDGCCIGVPPSPYDAVEVKLAKMVTGDARFAVTGGVVGKFKVDPYVVKNPRGDWLVGMYTMSAADFLPEDIGDGAGS